MPETQFEIVTDLVLERMQPADWSEVARLIHDSTNGWYEANRNHLIFPHGPESTLLFCDVYEELDPGCCIVARSGDSNRIVGSCFFHPRETHFSLGIMNVHPDAFGKGIARSMLQQIIGLATAEQKPVRLVSSAMNLDSFSLYTRAGFVPRQTLQDMILEIPADGVDASHPLKDRIRDAVDQDVEAMGRLERQVAGIQREQDYQYFVANRAGYWHTSVLKDGDQLAGWIVSIAHPASCMIGPCVAKDEDTALALLLNEINYRAGNTMVFLVPVDCHNIVQAAYRRGARNCELHVAQVLGEFQPFKGVVMPSFMPETA
ncbi:MAG: GNAT family N-acetyltransferase [Pirellulaceae bacterium]